MTARARSLLLVGSLTWAAVILTAAPTAWGDVFYLSNGGRIEGKLLNPKRSPRANYIVKSGLGATLTLPQDQVERVVIKSKMQSSYEAKLQTLPDTAKAHFDMADRCKRAKMEKERVFHLEQVLRLDPDHKESRYALGYSRIEGRWMRQDEWMIEQGYVRDRGVWRLPQEMEILRAANAADQITIDWRKKLKTWRGWIIKNRDRAVEGDRNIRSIRDPRAAIALAEQLDNEKEPRHLKLMYVDTLGSLPSAVSIDALVKHSMDDADSRVREACRDEVTRIGSQRAVESFIMRLKDPDRIMVNRAAAALGRLKAKSATLPLIDALVTEHKVLTGGGGGLTPSFSDQGGGLSAGGGPKIEEIEFSNQPVLNALMAIHRGVNYGFNKKAWKNWYVQKNVPQAVNLRRSD
jgi:hypothetical protein